jgi:RNA polymerase sigma factor (sigma-70 family)
MMDDASLVRDYVGSGSEAAFAQLVAHHADLVYSVALRVVGGDAHLARDVAQIVFTDLARKAASLPDGTVLGGWLHRHALFTAAKVVRAQRRRQAREQEALSMEQVNAPSDEQAWQQMAPLLDDAIQQLREPERQAILLRFFERKPLREVGMALCLEEDAARKRVDRAIEKLRTLLARRGITSTASGITAALVASAVLTAPAGLAASLATGALAASNLAVATTTSSTVLSLLKLMTIGKTLKIAAAVVLVAGSTAMVIHQATRRSPPPPKPSPSAMQEADLPGLKEGAPIDPEKLQRLAWGPPAPNGLRAACYFEPTKDAYENGEVVKRQVAFHNNAKAPVLFTARLGGNDDEWTVLDEQGRKVPLDHVYFGVPILQLPFRLQPGHAIEIACMGTRMGAGKRADGVPADTTIQAEPGKACRVSWSLTVYETTRLENGQKMPMPDVWHGKLTTGEVRFRIAEPPLKAELIALTNTYELDPAMSSQGFAEKLKKASAERDLPARPPKVNLILRLSNVDTNELTFGVGARNSTMDLDLQGPKVVNVNPVLPMSQELMFGTNITLQPSEHYDIPIASLISGTFATGRWSGTGKFSYWLEPGDYTLTATFNTTMGPTRLTVAAAPVRLKVVKGR